MEILLNPSQRKIVESDIGKNILIRGVAGSGKTTIGVNRISYLSKFYCYEKDDNILFITYNRTLISYIKSIYKKMEDEYSLLEKNKNVKIKTIDSLIYQLAMKFSNNYKLINKSEKYIYLNKAFAIEKKNYNKNVWEDISTKFLIGEIDYINANNIENLERYQKLIRTGRLSYGEETKKLSKNSKKREFIYNVYSQYMNLLVKNNKTDFLIRAKDVYKKLKNNVPKGYKHTHIIIDEAQDLTKMQLKIVNLLKKDIAHSSIMLISDTSQSIYPNSYLSYNSFKSAGFDVVGRSYILSKNYRTTCQIGNAAYSLIENDSEIVSNENYVKPSVLDKNGQYPLMKKFEDQKKQFAYIFVLISKKLSKKHELSSIAVCTKQNNHLADLKIYLASKGIEATIFNDKNRKSNKDAVKLVTFHSIKGLEFDVVILFNVNDEVIPSKYCETDNEISMERRLLYVAMTRAKQRLYIFSYKKESEFLSDIDSKFVRTKENEAFSDFYNISANEFRFKEKIRDINSYEEIVRQWFINELIDKLNYPIDMIDIEYEVKNFSKTGYVDVVCYQNINNIKAPYVFCEIKRSDSNLNEGINQLTSYMNTHLSVMYGVISNGRETQILMRYGKRIIKVNALAEYKKNIDKNVEIYEMIKVSNNRSIFIEIDENNHANYLNDKRENLFDHNQEIFLGVYGQISAGGLKYAEENIIRDFPMCGQIISEPDKYFLLEVNGDSMINAGIDDKDYVLIKKQNHASEADIVCAMVNDEATVKRISFRRDGILLIPENEKYNPITIRDENFHINGVLWAIIKKKEGYYG